MIFVCLDEAKKRASCFLLQGKTHSLEVEFQEIFYPTLGLVIQKGLFSGDSNSLLPKHIENLF